MAAFHPTENRYIAILFDFPTRGRHLYHVRVNLSINDWWVLLSWIRFYQLLPSRAATSTNNSQCDIWTLDGYINAANCPLPSSVTENSPWVNPPPGCHLMPLNFALGSGLTISPLGEALTTRVQLGTSSPYKLPGVGNNVLPVVQYKRYWTVDN